MKPIIFANLKCNPKTLSEAKQFFISVLEGLKNIKYTEVVFCPTFIYIPILVSLLQERKDLESRVKIAAQDCFWEQEGPFTGEVSPAMLKDIGCEYVLIDHSERKKIFGENETIANQKLKAALATGLTSVLFFGEFELATREIAEKEILRQLELLIKDIAIDSFDKIIFVYEPVFSISSSGGRKLTPDELKEKVVFIRDYFNSRFKKEIRLIYGGSVDGENIEGYLKSGVEGGVPGRASLKVETLLATIEACDKS
jgi:triosephosphate isomerase